MSFIPRVTHERAFIECKILKGMHNNVSLYRVYYIGKELILQIIDYDIPCKDALLCSNLT